MKNGVNDFEIANKPIIRMLMIMHMIWNQEWFQGMCYRNPSNDPWKDGDLAWPYIKTRILIGIRLPTLLCFVSYF